MNTSSSTLLMLVALVAGATATTYEDCGKSQVWSSCQVVGCPECSLISCWVRLGCFLFLCLPRGTRTGSLATVSSFSVSGCDAPPCTFTRGSEVTIQLSMVSGELHPPPRPFWNVPSTGRWVCFATIDRSSQIDGIWFDLAFAILSGSGWGDPRRAVGHHRRRRGRAAAHGRVRLARRRRLSADLRRDGCLPQDDHGRSGLDPGESTPPNVLPFTHYNDVFFFSFCAVFTDGHRRHLQGRVELSGQGRTGTVLRHDSHRRRLSRRRFTIPEIVSSNRSVRWRNERISTIHGTTSHSTSIVFATSCLAFHFFPSFVNSFVWLRRIGGSAGDRSRRYRPDGRHHEDHGWLIRRRRVAAIRRIERGSSRPHFHWSSGRIRFFLVLDFVSNRTVTRVVSAAATVDDVGSRRWRRPARSAIKRCFMSTISQKPKQRAVSKEIRVKNKPATSAKLVSKKDSQKREFVVSFF